MSSIRITGSPALIPTLPLNRSLTPTRSSTVAPALGLVLMLAAGAALAGTTGTEFQTMYTTLLNWATGFLGKSIAIAAFRCGAPAGSSTRMKER
jgi:hypothetical protein